MRRPPAESRVDRESSTVSKRAVSVEENVEEAIVSVTPRDGGPAGPTRGRQRREHALRESSRFSSRARPHGRPQPKPIAAKSKTTGRPVRHHHSPNSRDPEEVESPALDDVESRSYARREGRATAGRAGARRAGTRKGKDDELRRRRPREESEERRNEGGNGPAPSLSHPTAEGYAGR